MKLWDKTGLNVPCRITVLRILGIPVFITLVYYYTSSIERGVPNEYYRLTALILFAGIALTDFLDGYVARSRNLVTRLGSILDPIADKALLLAGLISLTKPSIPALQPQIPEWFTILVISREVVLFVGAFLIHVIAGHAIIRPQIAGKIATFLLLWVIFLVLLGCPSGLFKGLVACTAVFTLISGLQYTADGLQQMAKAN